MTPGHGAGEQAGGDVIVVPFPAIDRGHGKPAEAPQADTDVDDPYRHVILGPMDCPYCRIEMADGRVAVRGIFPLSAWDAALEWEPAEVSTTTRRWRDFGKRRRLALLTGSFFRREERLAGLCLQCGAVVMDPAPAAPIADAMWGAPLDEPLGHE